MKRTIVLLMLVTAILLSMAGCTTDKGNSTNGLDKTQKAEVENDLEIFSDGNISEITTTIFGDSSDDVVTDDSSEGIIATLFANAEASVSATDESTITYTITAPDISDFFQAKEDELDAITTSEELGQAILEYAKTAPQKEYTVSLDYSTSETGIVVSYDDPEFINAMTGGLLDAYAALYEQYLEEEG